VVAGITRKRGQKNDRFDAHDLAEKLRTGTLEKRIFKGPRQFTMLRELARVHMALARDLVRVQARLKSVYRSRGIGTAGRTVYTKAGRGAWQRQLPASSRKTAARLYEKLDLLTDLKEQAEQDLVREADKAHKLDFLRPIDAVLESYGG
jgi:hypothetical protein